MEDLKEPTPNCIHCWIPVVKQPEMKILIGSEEDGRPRWIHTKLTNDVGNSFCGRQFLEDEEVESVYGVAEA